MDRCFFNAISMTGEGETARIDEDYCMGCGVCIPTCDGDAIFLKEVEPLESIPE